MAKSGDIISQSFTGIWQPDGWINVHTPYVVWSKNRNTKTHTKKHKMEHKAQFHKKDKMTMIITVSDDWKLSKAKQNNR